MVDVGDVTQDAVDGVLDDVIANFRAKLTWALDQRIMLKEF